MLHNRRNFHSQRNFQQSRKFFRIKGVFHRRENFPQLKIFTQSRKFFAGKDRKGTLKAKILDPLKSKSYAKTFLMSVSDKRSYANVLFCKRLQIYNPTKI